MIFKNNATRIVYDNIIKDIEVDRSYTAGMLNRLTEIRLLSTADDEVTRKCITEFISTVDFFQIRDAIHEL